MLCNVMLFLLQLTNATSVKSDRSEDTGESDQDQVSNELSTNSKDTQEDIKTPPVEDAKDDQLELEQNTPPKPVEPTPTEEHLESAAEEKNPPKSNEDLALRSFDRRSPILDSQAFLQSEKQPSNQRSPKQKIGKRLLALFIPKQTPVKRLKKLFERDNRGLVAKRF